MVRILAVADEVEQAAYAGLFAQHQPDLVIACGDLPFDYLEYLVTTVGKPLVYVPGNHDPGIGRRFALPGAPAARESHPKPEGCINLDGRVEDVAGVRVAGLGGSHVYSRGANQYSQNQMRGRSLALEMKLRLRRVRNDHSLDVLVTHAPPLGVGDDSDPAHRGFAAFNRLLKKTSPRLHVHGHIHSYGRPRSEHKIGATRVVNVVGHKLLEIRL
jgi:Icc-related predicted phosphoesterase